MRVFKPVRRPRKLWRLSPELWRPRPRAFVEWSTLRRWNALPYWELDPPGYLLREARQDAGLSQPELGAKLGISQQAVSRAERWDSNPTVEFIRRWSVACGRPITIQCNV